jgi:deoxyhypusine synthase
MASRQVVGFIEAVESLARTNDIMFVVNCGANVDHDVLEMRACCILLAQEVTRNTKYKHRNLRLHISLLFSFTVLVCV